MLYEPRREEILAIIEDLKNYHLLDCTGGALSTRCDEHILITITGSARRRWHLSKQDFIVLDLIGNVVEIEKKLGPIGTLMHLVIYNLFPNCHAIIHTHSTYSLAFASVGLDIPCTIDAIDILREIPCLRTESDAKNILDKHDSLDSLLSNIIGKANGYYTRLPAIKQLKEKFLYRQSELLNHGLAFTEFRHGIYTFASDLSEAFTTLARIEAGAKNCILSSSFSTISRT